MTLSGKALDLTDEVAVCWARSLLSASCGQVNRPRVSSFTCVQANTGKVVCVMIRYEVDCESFKGRVSECVATSRERLYIDPDPDDPNAIRFVAVVAVFSFVC